MSQVDQQTSMMVCLQMVSLQKVVHDEKGKHNGQTLGSTVSHSQQLLVKTVAINNARK
jgi:hypothetical protein